VTILSAHVVADLVVILLTLAARAATVNRLVSRKLRLSLLVALLSLVASLVRLSGWVPAALDAQVRSVDSLLVALAAINLLVVVAINPLREDRVPARFPNIVQDAIIVGVFLLAATAVLQEKFLTTSAVGAVVVGFALQDTLGNAFAGLAIQTEKPYHVGQWIRVGEHEGCVEEITWRATKLRTKASNFVIIPNNVMSKDPIVNYSEPVVPTRLTVEVGASYLVPPNDVKAAILEAIGNVPLALATPAPDVLLIDFGASAIVYRAWFWVEDYGQDEAAKSQVRTSIWYTFKRRNIEIPWPIQVEYQREEAAARPADLTSRMAETLGQVEVLASLAAEERLELAAMCDERLYARGEVVVRRDAPGASMFVVSSGEVEILLGPEARRIAVTSAGGFFGEMSLLTGNPRTATVRAIDDCTLVEITAEAFRRFVLERPAVLEAVAVAVMERSAAIERSRAEAVVAPGPAENAVSFLGRVRRFLRIPA
jgi:small-conductance mechanosensitive channel